MPGSKDHKHPDIHEITVMEVLQSSSYTYVKGAEKNRVLWMAIPRMEVQKGEKYYFYGGMEMREFRSKELDRVFPSIWFLNGLVHPDELKGGGRTEEVPGEEEILEIPEGCVSIEELYQQAEKYENCRIRVAGRVSKFNSGIMGRNWIHISDGSGTAGNNDLTITTSEVLVVGDRVILEGDLHRNKNFGAGYFYELILENASIHEQ